MPFLFIQTVLQIRTFSENKNMLYNILSKMNNEVSVSISNFPLEPVIATSIRFSVMELVLNSHVTLHVSFLNANGNPVKNEMVKIEGSEYAAWGINDQYLTDLVLQKLGLVASTA
jgi:hypothetical protein